MLNALVVMTNDIRRLRRFLCFGSESLTFQAAEKDDLSVDSAQCIQALLEANGSAVVDEIVKFSQYRGNSTKRLPAIFALAVCARSANDVTTKHTVYNALNDVCPTSVDLFQFIDYIEKLGKSTGWGRAQRRAIAAWYNSRDPLALATEVTRYRTRKGWSHGDVLRLAHVKAQDEAHDIILKYIWKGISSVQTDKDQGNEVLISYIEAVEKVKHSKDDLQVAGIVEQYKLHPQQIPTWMNKSKEVWRALVQHMTLQDLMENIDRIALLGLLDVMTGDSIATLVIERLKSPDLIRESRILPFTLLLAMKTYEKGKLLKGKKTEWTTNGAVLDAMKNAFYSSFKNIDSTGKRYLLAVDVSASMQYGGVNGADQVTPSVAMAAMALLTAKTERSCDVVGFSDNITRVAINREMNLEEVQHAISEVKMGGTDCAQPITWAAKQKKEFDVFIVYTDCETWTGSSQSPAEALKRYRDAMKISNAKLIVCALTSNGFQLDESDAGILGVAGFTDTTPGVIRRFIMDEL